LAEKIKCSHILVKKQSEAITLLERLKKGESFANLSKEYSTDRGSAKRGGKGYHGKTV
jgi:foldase protein PrsA